MQARRSNKSGTAYQGSTATRACMYCNDVFRSTVKQQPDGLYRTLSALRQLEQHYVEKHARKRV